MKVESPAGKSKKKPVPFSSSEKLAEDKSDASSLGQGKSFQHLEKLTDQLLKQLRSEKTVFAEQEKHLQRLLVEKQKAQAEIERQESEQQKRLEGRSA